MANSEHVEVVKQGAEAIEEWRKANPDIQLDLMQADLEGANLGHANLSGANLSGANLSGANLSGANLIYTNLRSVDMSGADLRGADIGSSNLGLANLSGADMGNTQLRRAFLGGANLKRAIFAYTVICDCDLRGAKGLNEIEHRAPSTIGIDTLYKSKGDIPEVFLCGCGVPDNMIEFMRPLPTDAFDFFSCFISYSSEDKAFARRLYSALQERGVRCWLDEHQLFPGDGIDDAIDRGIKLWDKVILCGSENSLTSWWVDSELERAFKKERELMKQHGKKVRVLIPLALDDYMFDTWEDGKKDEVLSRSVAKFEGWKNDNDIFEKQFERVVKALHADDKGRETPPPKKLGKPKSSS